MEAEERQEEDRSKVTGDADSTAAWGDEWTSQYHAQEAQEPAHEQERSERAAVKAMRAARDTSPASPASPARPASPGACVAARAAEAKDEEMPSAGRCAAAVATPRALLVPVVPAVQDAKRAQDGMPARSAATPRPAQAPETGTTDVVAPAGEIGQGKEGGAGVNRGALAVAHLRDGPDSTRQGRRPETGRHENVTNKCRVCSTCFACSGYGPACLRHRAGRQGGAECGCGTGKSGCAVCGRCEKSQEGCA